MPGSVDGGTASRRPGRRVGRAVTRALVGTLTFTLVVGGAAVGVVALLRHLERTEPEPVRCAAESDGTSWFLQTDQADTAALLTATSMRRELPARAATIAIATGLQESRLRNIDYGDRDSVGIFQQRPSQGWGSVEEIMDPVYSTNAFYDGLVAVDGYQEMEITVAAQAVQRSGFPDAYAQHEARSRAWASALTGHSPAALTCTLPAATVAGDPQAVLERVERDFGLTAEVTGEREVVIDASALTRGDDVHRVGWAAAQWAVAVAEPLQVVAVAHADQVWDRAAGAWDAATEPVPDGQVRITLAD